MTALSPRAADGSSPAAARLCPDPIGADSPPAALGRPTVVLTDGRAGPAAAIDQVQPRRVAAQLAVAALIVLTLVGVVGALVSRQVAQQQAMHDVAELTDVLAQTVLQPALTDDMRDSPAAARLGLGQVVHDRVLSATLVRVKLWSPEGAVLYSDEPQLVGRTFTLDDEARRALTVPQTDASVSDLDRPENQFERSEGKLLEVYRPVWTPGGHPLLFETYFRYDTVSERSHGLWLGFVGIIVSSLAALLLLLTPIVWSLLRRTQRAQDQRQALTRRALASSDAERARVAASLHDGVVQDLVAANLHLSGQAQRAAATGDLERSADLNAAAAQLRSSIGSLRSLLVEIYPPNLANAGLLAALRDLGATLERPGIVIAFELDEDAIARLSPTQSEAVFRVVQESVRNAIKHADPSTITVSIAAHGDWVEVNVDDDGAGFDPLRTIAGQAEHRRDGHLGLLLLTDAATEVGAILRVSTGPGLGTNYELQVPTR
jgi:signal transduction histidine kinase